MSDLLERMDETLRAMGKAITPLPGYCLTCRTHKSGIFCPNCGRELVREAPEAVCGRCEEPLQDRFRFCPGCGLPAAMAKAWTPGQAAPDTPIAVGSDGP